MSEFAFHALNKELHDALALPPVPFPVRTERQAAIFGTGKVRVDQLLVELDLFLRENPQLAPHYVETAGILGFTIGLDLVTEGRAEEALRCFEIGLAHRPENLSLRTQYALALHSLGRHAEALRHYEHVIRDPDMGVEIIIWLAAARLHASTGHPGRALELLRDCHRVGFEEPAFMRFLAETERAAGAEPTPSDTATARRCTSCGRELAPGRKFCTGCGQAINA